MYQNMYIHICSSDIWDLIISMHLFLLYRVFYLTGCSLNIVFLKISSYILDSGSSSVRTGLSWRLSLVVSVCTPDLTLKPLDGRSPTELPEFRKIATNTTLDEHPVYF